MPARPSTWLLRRVSAVRACCVHLAAPCLTLSRVVWGGPRSVLISWWVPALVQPSLVPLGCLSRPVFLLHFFLLFSPLSRFFLMCSQIFVLSSHIMAPVLNSPPHLPFLLSVQSARVLWSSSSIVRCFLVLLAASVPCGGDFSCAHPNAFVSSRYHSKIMITESGSQSWPLEVVNGYLLREPS